jgi:hypothetical protein
MSDRSKLEAANPPSLDSPAPGSPTTCASAGDLAERSHARRQVAIALALTLLGLGVSLALGIASNGVYMDDDVSHHMFARDAWTDANALLHSWARPGFTLPMCVAAHFFGFAGSRVLSALMTAGVAWLAFCISRRIASPGADWPAWAPLAVWAQPLVLVLSFTSLTETPAALYLALGMWLHLRGNRVWACAFYSLLFVTRYETLALAPLLGGAVAYDALRLSRWRIGDALKRWWLWAAAMAMLWAPVAYLAAASMVSLEPDGSPWTLFSRQYTREYGSGAIWHFLSIWPEGAGLGLLALAAAGSIALGRRAWLSTAVIVALVALHSYLFWRGSFATGGYARFLVPLAAPLGMLTAAGANHAWRARSRWASAVVPLVIGGLWALTLLTWRNVLLPFEWSKWACELALGGLSVSVALAVGIGLVGQAWRRLPSRACVAVAMVVLAVQLVAQVRPMDLRRERFHRVVSDTVTALAKGPYAERPGISQHVLICFLREGVEAASGNVDAMDQWRDAPPGTLFFWENKYCYKSHEMPSTLALCEQLQEHGRLVHEEEYETAVVQVFEKLASSPSDEGAQTR